MNVNRFTDRKTGRIVPIRVPGGNDFSFIPDDLPPKWTFPASLWPKLSEAKMALGRLDGIGRTLPSPELLLTPLRRQEAITSSRIEGTYATAQEMLLFEIAPKEPRSRTDQAHAWSEVQNYIDALGHGTKLLDKYPFCLRVFKQLHHTLMRGVRGQLSNPGKFRDVQVAIGSDRRYIPPPPVEMMSCLEALEKYINSDDTSFDPLVRAYVAHYQFEAIHPFSDGNGRIGRLLLSLMIEHACKMQLPWLYMSSFFERFKSEYVDNLLRVSTEGNWEKWIDFCLTGTIKQAEDAVKRCDALRRLKEEMINKARADGSVRTERIIESLFTHPIVRVSRLQRTLDVTYPTAQADITRLVKAGVLRPLPGVRPKAFYSPEIMDIAYSEAKF